eukprot:c2818_g1_i1 orf=3-296(-)
MSLLHSRKGGHLVKQSLVKTQKLSGEPIFIHVSDSVYEGGKEPQLSWGVQQTPHIESGTALMVCYEPFDNMRIRGLSIGCQSAEDKLGAHIRALEQHT